VGRAAHLAHPVVTLLACSRSWEAGRCQGCALLCCRLAGPTRALPGCCVRHCSLSCSALAAEPNSTQMLHSIYVYLAGTGSNPQDLGMNLNDIRLGLKHAAGYRSAQE